ncbi:hypothetical protein D3C75_1097930 [compost metagenome]
MVLDSQRRWRRLQCIRRIAQCIAAAGDVGALGEVTGDFFRIEHAIAARLLGIHLGLDSLQIIALRGFWFLLWLLRQ